jgi:hypothetical protein
MEVVVKQLLLRAVTLVVLLSPTLTPAASACTVSTLCYSTCVQHVQCAFAPCNLSCSYPSASVSCSGTTCSSDATSVKCDNNNPIVCPATPVCANHSDWIQCGSTIKACAAHGSICPV